MHKDNAPRLFNYWTPDGYNSGRYNLLCLGFVQISNRVGLGATFGLDPRSKNSGHFPGEGFGKATYARSLEVVDQDNNLTRVIKLVTQRMLLKRLKTWKGFEAVVATGAKEIAVFAHGDWVPS
ncbi:hypothetical protein Tco_0684994 [Tanacetum coccineum]